MSRFDPYYEWLGIPESDQPANHYRLLSIPMYEMNIEVIKSASERQTIFLRTLQAGEHASAAAQLLNEVAAARVCLLNAQQKEAYDTQMRFALPNPVQVLQPLADTMIPDLPIPHAVPIVQPQNETFTEHKKNIPRRIVTPVWQRASIMVPVALVCVTILIVLVWFSFGDDDTPFVPPPVARARQPMNLGPSVGVDKAESLARPPTVAPSNSNSMPNGNDEQEAGTPVPNISDGDIAMRLRALSSARALQVQRNLVAAAEQLEIVKPLSRMPQYNSEFARADFIQQLLEEFMRLTRSTIDSYIPGSEIMVGDSNVAIVVEVTSRTLTVKVNGEVKEYLRDDLVLGVAMGIAATSFEDGPMKGFIQAAYLLTFPDRQDSYLVRARELWEVGDANLAPGGSFEQYLRDFEDVVVPKLAQDLKRPTDGMQHKDPTFLLPTVQDSTDMQFVRVSGGTFEMGSPDSELWRYNDETEHVVTISRDYLMQTTEVTQSQWTSLMGTEPWKGKEYVKEGANYPAVYVSWDDAVAYCEKLSEKEGKMYRLPTEAEWEYACRAGTATTWSFGDDEKTLGDYAWGDENANNIIGKRYAHQVGLKNPNAFGLYDMHGNVWEWCQDYYEEDYYRQSIERDPTGPASGDVRVLRGGSWNGLARDTRSANRAGVDADFRRDDKGFRLVYEISVDDAQLTSDGNSGPSMIPIVEELDLLELATTMKIVREALEARDMETATTELKKAQSLPRSPELAAVVLRLAKMTELLNEFIKNSEDAINGFSPGSKIMVAGSTTVSVASVSQTELVIKVGGRLRTYAHNQLSVAIAMGIADTYFADNEYTTSLKAAFIATQKKPRLVDITSAKELWELGPEPIETLNLYLVDRYEFQVDNAIAESPDNPLVYTIDLLDALPAYRKSIPYDGTVETSNITVQFDITARGTRAFPSETDQNEPVAINKSFNAEIMLGQYVQAAVGKRPAAAFDFIGDVLVRLSYDAKKKEFNIYVKPTANVGAEKQNSTVVGLSAKLSEQRALELQQTIVRTMQEIGFLHPNNMAQLNTTYQQLETQRAAAANLNTVTGALTAANIATQMNQIQAKYKVQNNLQTSKRNRLPAFRFNLAYLQSLTKTLSNLKYLDIRYKIYQKMGDENLLIIDGW